MTKIPDFNGKTFGRLTVLYQVEDIKGKDGYNHNAWMCECSCENHTKLVVLGSDLKSGSKTSCGCLIKENREINRIKRRKLNNYDLSGEFGIGWTVNTNEEFYFDLEDYDKIKNYTWKRSRHHESIENGYLCTHIEHFENGKRIAESIFFHKLITDYQLVDHKNQNKLDNRKENLRPCTQSQNMQNVRRKINNTSGIIGVTYSKKSKKWVARINPTKGNRIFLGQFANKEDAIIARLKAEKEYYKEFAPQKHLFEKYGIE